jgi:hypothetical protein
MESFFGIFGGLAIVGLLALEGAFLYFVIFKRGRNTSLKKAAYKGPKTCPICGGTMLLVKEVPCCNNPKCVNYYP